MLFGTLNISADDGGHTGAAAHSSGTPIDMSNPTGGTNLLDFVDGKKFRLSGRKRRYRVLKKRKLDDLVFVF